MKSCVRFAPMIGSRPGELPDEDVRALASHLETCSSCRALAASFAATDGLVAEALLSRANERDFAPFVDEVMAKVSRRPFGRAQPAHGRSVLGVLQQRWKVMVAAAAAAVVLAAAASFMYGGKHVVAEEPERLASLEIELSGEGSIVLQTSDGPVVLLAPDDDTGS